MTERKPIPTRMLVLCALFTALIAVGAFIRVPVPLWPFTLQSLFAALAALLLGRRYGTLACAAYLALGLAGLPIFTKGGGPQYIFEPTFGCLLGFLAGAYVAGTVLLYVKTRSFRVYLLAALADMSMVYAIGMAWFWAIKSFYLHDPIGVWPLFVTCFAPTIGADLMKMALAAGLARRLVPALGRGIPEN